MSTYVLSDIHGDFDAYKKMLEKINFSDADILYISVRDAHMNYVVLCTTRISPQDSRASLESCDIVDRGEHPVKILLDVMDRTNVVFVIGNHELMLDVYEEITVAGKD